MKKVYLIVVGLSALLAGGPPARAQAPDELQTFQGAAAERSILYRGKQAARYNFPANGNPYWERPEYRLGDVTFEGNLYRDVLLNIDALNQHALVQIVDGPFAVALPPSLTPSLTMGGRRFEGFGPDEALPEGFYEVLGQGPERVYKHVSKVLNSTIGNHNGDTIGYVDPNYRSDIMRHFAIRRTYYFRDREGNFSRIKNRRALIRKFPDRQRELRRAVQEATSGSRDLDFDSICEVILYAAAR